MPFSITKETSRHTSNLPKVRALVKAMVFSKVAEVSKPKRLWGPTRVGHRQISIQGLISGPVKVTIYTPTQLWLMPLIP
jgi:hypothetical protein